MGAARKVFHGEAAHNTVQPDRLPRPAPFHGQGIRRRNASLGLKAEAPVIGGVAEHIDLDCTRILKPPQSLTNERAAEAAPLPIGSDRERPQERDLIRTFRNAACGEDNMPHQNAIGNSHKRENDCLFAQEFPHRGKQILVRKCAPI